MQNSEIKIQNIKWEAWEFKLHQRSSLWYIVSLLLAVALIGYGVYTRNILTIVTFVVAAAAWFFYSMQTPRLLVHELTTTGIRVGEVFFPFRNIKKFWIIYTEANKSLNLETTAYLNNHILLQLGKLNPTQVKQFLKAYIPEDLDRQENISDVIARKIKF